MNLATYGCQIDAKYENQVIIKKEIQVKSFMRTKFVFTAIWRIIMMKA
jgi:hypothetical protein